MDKFPLGTAACMIVLPWTLVLWVFSSAIKIWRYKGCLKQKLLEHAKNNISVPKAAEPFSFKIVCANRLRHTLAARNFGLNCRCLAISSWENSVVVGWEFYWPLPVSWDCSLLPSIHTTRSVIEDDEGILWQVNQGNHALPESSQTSKTVLPLLFTASDLTGSQTGLWNTRYYWVLELLKLMLFNPWERSR